MTNPKTRFRIFASCDIGDEAFKILRARGYDVEVYPEVEPPPST